jgi:hypothetical protein
MINERQAWLYLASACHNAKARPNGEHFLNVSQDTGTELDCGIQLLFDNKMIEFETKLSMFGKLFIHCPPSDGNGWYWTKDKAGMQAREEFCKRMITTTRER